MLRFKKRKGESDKLEKTLTILDSETKEVKEIIDITEEVKIITLVDEEVTKYSEIQLQDMSFMKTLRDAYPSMENMQTFLTDACASHKALKDEKNNQLTDEEKAAEQEKLDKIAESDAKTAKLLTDEALKKEKLDKDRQIEIEEAERKRHATAQKN